MFYPGQDRVAVFPTRQISQSCLEAGLLLCHALAQDMDIKSEQQRGECLVSPCLSKFLQITRED